MNRHRSHGNLLSYRPQAILRRKSLPSVSCGSLNQLRSTGSNSGCLAIAPFPYPRFGEEHYQPSDFEIPEEDLFFIEEGPIDKDHGNTLPVRILNDYAVYLSDSGILVPMPALNGTTIASGLARPKLLDDAMELCSDADPDDIDCPSQAVTLGTIQEIWLDTVNYCAIEIWIRTNHAWYILEKPTKIYLPYLACTYIPHLLTCIICANGKDADISVDKIKDILDHRCYVIGPVLYAARVLCRPLTIEDFLLVEVEVRENLRSRKRHKGKKAVLVPQTARCPIAKDFIPFLMPTVGKIAQNLFNRALIIATNDTGTIAHAQSPTANYHLNMQFFTHKDDHYQVHWGPEVQDSKGTYKSVILDGVVYSKGDTVAVQPETESNDSNAWFCIIQYFFNKDIDGVIEPYFHGQWFSHGASVLGETTDPWALFLLDMCSDIHVSAILKKIIVYQCHTLDTKLKQANDSDTFYFRFKWNQDDFSLTDPEMVNEDVVAALSYQDPQRQCFPCAWRIQNDILSNCRKMKDPNFDNFVLSIYGTDYHVHDLVYVKKGKYGVLTIAQITSLMPDSGGPELVVQFLDRQTTDNIIQDSNIMHILEARGKPQTIQASQLDGHCQIGDITSSSDQQTWGEIGENISTRYPFSLLQCNICLSEEQEWAITRSQIVPLKALDLFCGAGGLTTGIGVSGFVRTHWAIDISASATLTIKHNHPDIQVYCQEANALLRHAVESKSNRSKQPMYSLDEHEPLPALPLPGEVEIILGGPPCQCFSVINRYRNSDDIRSTLMATFLSYVEYYKPTYLLIENVTGILSAQLLAQQTGIIKSGMVKFILCALTNLGYQVQVRVLNAADYGSPQQRNRVIFWGAKLGHPLPEWPIPTHLPKHGHKLALRNVSGVGDVPLATRNPLVLEDYAQCSHAPSYSVTVDEAIRDLPGFHWTLSESSKGKIPFIAATRTAAAAAGKAVGYSCPMWYRHKPDHPYQKWCRQNVSERGKVSDQVTLSYSSSIVGRIIGAFPSNAGENEGFSRLDPDQQFMTTLTRMKTMGTNVHPFQDRLLTVRELARAQGFPDDYHFMSVEPLPLRVISDQTVQIGNAVPVHLAIALGKGLGITLIQELMKNHCQKHTSGIKFT